MINLQCINIDNMIKVINYYDKIGNHWPICTHKIKYL